jgi:ribosomal protein S27E
VASGEILISPRGTPWEYRLGVSKARNWLQEERRRTLGDWVAVCLGCGFAQRYFEESEAELPATCPQCGGEIRARCPECGARFSSAFAVDCEACGAALRPAEQFGVRIRKTRAR